MKTYKEIVAEAFYHNSVAMLPATRVLHNKNKIHYSEIDKRHDHTAVVATLHGNDSSKDRHVYISGYGHDTHFKVGAKHNWHHDQMTGQRGHMTIRNVIHLDKDNNIVHKENEYGVAPHIKLPLYVLK